MEECLERYSPSQVAVCFNGGKDCIVMLHLAHAAFSKRHPEAEGGLQMIYIT